jgi:hypothetical protein
MAEKTISGDPEMIRIAREFFELAIEAMKESNRALQIKIDAQQATIDMLVRRSKFRVLK